MLYLTGFLCHFAENAWIFVQKKTVILRIETQVLLLYNTQAIKY